VRFSIVGIASIVSVLAACSSAPVAPASTPATKAVASATPAPTSTATPPSPRQSDAEVLAARLRAQQAELNAKSVYFDFDDYSIKPTYDDMLHRQADFLKAAPADRLTVQGNTDERGGSEYNLALGQKRAEAVRKALMVLGASGDRIEATSFGKEKPRASCHEESCWSQNRRVDFVNGDRH
jgi:peptidoglycan-associated lipoprotein